MSLSRREFAPAPAAPRLTSAVVDVWRADLAAAGGAYGELLSADERARGARILRIEHRRRWEAARGVLRALLGRYLDVDPRSLRFELGTHGKPALAQPPDALSFNLSHAGSVALYVVAVGREVGIDVEREDRRMDPVAVARRVFGAEEAERLRALDEPTRRREFLRAWVRHEARVKCRGTGIGADQGEQAGVPPPRVTDLELEPGTVGAVAVADGGRAFELRCWQWPPEAPA